MARIGIDLGTTNTVVAMVYDDGDGELFVGFTDSIDVIAHELTHGVTQFATPGGLDYEDQSGALNESISDVFGSLVLQYSHKQTAAQATWLIGQGLFTARVKGVALRSMKAPGTAYDDPVLGKDPQPATMAGYVETEDDDGGVHTNSGIPNHAYYLIVQNIGRKDAEQVMYRVLTEELGPDSGFEDFRTASLKVARDLFGEGSSQVAQIDQSFAAVGLDGTWEAPEVEGC